VTLRAPTVAIVLAAFAATIAVPAPQVVSHRHGGGEQAHVHAVVEHTHDGTAHRHVVASEHDGRHGRHGDGVFVSTDAAADHVHVVSPFQPATPSAPTFVARVARVDTIEIAPPVAPASPSLPVSRSRGPPPAARV
jgi:hypothetical protein